MLIKLSIFITLRPEPLTLVAIWCWVMAEDHIRQRHLLRFAIITANGLNARPDCKFSNDINTRVKPRLNFALNNAVIKAAITGFGITRLQSYQIAAKICSFVDLMVNKLRADKALN